MEKNQLIRWSILNHRKGSRGDFAGERTHVDSHFQEMRTKSSRSVKRERKEIRDAERDGGRLERRVVASIAPARLVALSFPAPHVPFWLSLYISTC